MPYYKCERCGKIFSQKSHIDNHFNKKYICEGSALLGKFYVEHKINPEYRYNMFIKEIDKLRKIIKKYESNG